MSQDTASKIDFNALWDRPEKFWVQWSTSRILGPLSIVRIAEFLRKGQFTGEEPTRGQEGGKWVPMVAHPLLNPLVLQALEGKLAVPNLPSQKPELPSGLEEKPGGEKEGGDEEEDTGTNESFNFEVVEMDTQAPALKEDEKTLVNPYGDQLSEFDLTDSQINPDLFPDLKEEDAEAEMATAIMVPDPENPRPAQLDQEVPVSRDLLDVFEDETVVDTSPARREKTLLVDEGDSSIEMDSKSLPTMDRQQELNPDEWSTMIEHTKLSRPASQAQILESQGVAVSKGGLFRSRTSKTLALLALLYLLLDHFYPDGPDQAAHRILKDFPVHRVQAHTPPKKPKNIQYAKEYFEKGAEHLRHGTAHRTIQAVNLLSKAVSMNPDHGRALALLGIAYSRLIPFAEDRDLYLGVISHFLTLATRSATPPGLIAAMRAEIFLAFGQPASSLHILNSYGRVSKLEEDHAYVLVRAYLASGRFREAAQYLAALPNESMPLAFRMVLGRAYEGRGEEDNALSVYENIVERDPQYGPAWIRLAKIHASQEQEVPLQNAMEKGFLFWKSLFPKDMSEALYLRAHQFYAVQDLANSAKLLVQASQLNPDHLDARSTLTAIAKNMKVKNQKILRLTLNPASEELIDQGKALIQNGDFEAAGGLFLQAVQIAPYLEEPFLVTSSLFAEKGLLEAAVRIIQKGYKIHPKSIKISEKYGEILVKAQHLREAEPFLMKWRKHLRNKAAFPRLLGHLYMEQGRLEEASREYFHAISLVGLDSESARGLAKIYLLNEKLAEGESWLRKAVESDPLNMENHVLLSEIIQEIEGDTIAIGYLIEQLNRNPEEVELLVAITKLYWKIGDIPAFRKYMEVSEGLGSKHWKLAELKGEIAASERRWKDALKHWKEMSDLNPLNPGGYLQRASHFLRRDDVASVQEELERVENRVSRWPGLQLNFAKLYHLLGNATEARARAEKEILNHPESPDAYAFLGRIFLSNKDRPQALIQFKKALRIDEEHHVALLGQGMAMRMRGNTDGALQILEKARVSDPGDPETYREIGLGLLDLGQIQRARQNLQQYLTLNPKAKDRQMVIDALQKAQ